MHSKKISWSVVFFTIAALSVSTITYYIMGQNSANIYANIFDLTSSKQLVAFKPVLSLKPNNLPIIRGLAFDISQPLSLQFYFDTMSDKNISDKQANQLIKYFLSFLAIPQEKIWVNLSPYEKDRILPEVLEKLDIGKDLLIEDYILKQLTSSLTNPNSVCGRRFWQKVNKTIYSLTKNKKIPIELFNKIWIVPDKAQVYEKAGVDSRENNQDSLISTSRISAFIKSARLKVMTEEDFFSIRNNDNTLSGGLPGNNQQGTRSTYNTALIKQKIKEIFKCEILPLIEKEVNEGPSFSRLRQMYYAWILAEYFKKRKQIYNVSLYNNYINSEITNPIALNNPKGIKQEVYAAYLYKLKQGAYKSIIKNKSISRSYFSGGVKIVQPQNMEINYFFSLKKMLGLFKGMVYQIGTKMQPVSLDARGIAEPLNPEVALVENDKERGNPITLRMIFLGLKYFLLKLRIPPISFTDEQKIIMKEKADFIIKTFCKFVTPEKKEEIKQLLIDKVFPLNLFYTIKHQGFREFIENFHFNHILFVKIFLFPMVTLFSVNLFLPMGVASYFFLFVIAYLNCFINIDNEWAGTVFHSNMNMYIDVNKRDYASIFMHESIHRLYLSKYINTDLPVASILQFLYMSQGEFSLGKELFDRYPNDPQQRWVVILKELGAEVVKKGAKDYTQLVSDVNVVTEYLKQGGWKLDASRECVWTYYLGKALAQIAECLSEITKNPDAALEYMSLIAQGVSPVQAENIIRGFITGEEEYYDICLRKFKKGQYNEALGYINLAIAKNPNMIKAYKQRTLIYFKLKQFKEFISASEELIKLNPNDVSVYENLGYYYSEQEEREKSRIYLAKAFELILKNPEIAKIYIETNQRNEMLILYSDYIDPLEEAENIQAIKDKLRELVEKNVNNKLSNIININVKDISSESKKGVTVQPGGIAFSDNFFTDQPFKKAITPAKNYQGLSYQITTIKNISKS